MHAADNSTKNVPIYLRTADSEAYSCTVLVFRCPASSQTVQVDALVLDFFELVRRAKYVVTCAVVMPFGRSSTKTLLASATTSVAHDERLERFQEGEVWAKNFVVRNGPPASVSMARRVA